MWPLPASISAKLHCNMNTDACVDLCLNDVLDGKVALKIALVDAQGRSIGHLRPIVKADLADDTVAQALTDWRNANMRYFFGQFVATCERTKAWMARDLFASGGKLLFLIESDGRLVGHYGFKNLTADEVLLDNAMLGVRCAYPAIMRQAGLALIQWLFDVAQVKRVWAEVLTTNAPALMLNRQLGFAVTQKIPMIKSESEGQVTWTMGDAHSTIDADVHCYKLLLERDAFAQQAN